MGDVCFLDQGFGGFMGFHDWLRKKSLPNYIVGVRFWPHEDCYLPKEPLKGKDYVSLSPGDKSVGIWFGDCRSFDAEISGDQSFCHNRVLVSQDKTRIALILDASALTTEEFASVQASLKAQARRMGLS